MKQNRVTVKQAKLLKLLGFVERTNCYVYEDKNFSHISESGSSANWNKEQTTGSHNLWTSIPTVDEAIDWIRRKYNIIIYDKFAPFVDTYGNKFIWYAYGVKRCNLKQGWNFREYIGYSHSRKSPYSAKREAINIALKYITKNKAKLIKCRATATGRSKSKTK